MLSDFINNFINSDTSPFYINVLNLVVLFLLVCILYFVRRSRKKWTKINDYLGVMTNTVNSVRYGDLLKKLENNDIPETEPLADSLNRMIDTLYDREKMIVEYQNELNRQNKLLEGVINSLSDGLVVVDEHYKILRATPKISEWLKVEGKELIGLHLPTYIKPVKEKSFDALKNDDVIINEDSSKNYIASTIELKLEDRKKRFVLLVKNVTDQRELETLKEDFVATLTHDLKVPIIAETNMIELFLNGNFGETTEKQKLALKNMQSSNKELLDLVQIVLETYKFKDAKIRLFKENIMLKHFIYEIIDEMKPIAEKTKNELKLLLTHDVMVYADRMQLKRVIKNLIQNAISYGLPNSPIEITIGEIPKFVIITVKDYGAGISKKDINKIFNKYYSASKKFRKIGTGLGLYLAQQIVKSHGGEFTVESEEGKYTEFTIKLPAVINSTLHYGE